ncbi:MAG TPA: chromate resistance protein ChrB domain-containing protein [Gemmatimonadales bacterium]
MSDTLESTQRWLLLIHQLPLKPDYLRVKVRRRLQRLGAVPLKRTVYALPAGDEAREDFEWLAREIATDGGEAALCESTFLDADTDRRLVQAIRAACTDGYEAIVAASRGSTADLDRLTRRLHEVHALDRFAAEGRADAEAALEALATRTSQPGAPMTSTLTDRPKARVWVTRAGLYVDRIASAWLIRRFVDPEAQFRFVAPRQYHPQPGEIRFDMFEGEFTHDGDLCTFETLCRHFALRDPALKAISEMVHDIDCKDDKFGRDETPGLQLVLDGIARANAADVDRLARGAALFDELYEQLRKGRP